MKSVTHDGVNWFEDVTDPRHATYYAWWFWLYILQIFIILLYARCVRIHHWDVSIRLYIPILPNLSLFYGKKYAPRLLQEFLYRKKYHSLYVATLLFQFPYTLACKLLNRRMCIHMHVLAAKLGCVWFWDRMDAMILSLFSRLGRFQFAIF